MASDERGTKRTCPVTGKKFYDLNKDPVVSPYTGKSYPLSFFEAPPEKTAPKPAKEAKATGVVEEDETATEVDPAAAAAGAEVISLNQAEEEESSEDDEDIPDVEDVEVDDELGGDDDNTFLETDDDEDAIDFDVEVDEDER